jgi:hypothetical protein
MTKSTHEAHSQSERSPRNAAGHENVTAREPDHHPQDRTRMILRFEPN